MFWKLPILRKKHRNERRPSRFHRLIGAPESEGSNLSPLIIPGTFQEAQAVPISDPDLSQLSAATAARSNGPQKGVEPKSGPLGLTVVYTPENGHKVDIVFIHGLGGTSRWTWSKDRDPELFWPSKFLPFEPDICQARILTFGYNADFRKAGSVRTTVFDFAKDLLFDLKYARDEKKNDLDMGHVPLIFVAHSMGGLIVKEAYMQGQIDPEYQFIVNAITSIIFLSTPHRGTHLAETLNRILQSAMITNSKQYISELVQNSITLHRLNEQFRHIAPRLDIVSLYETQPTSILPGVRVMVLEKDSSVLGYPGEISKALNADHHGVCKYDSPTDPNYIIVRNVLISLLRKTSLSGISKQITQLDRMEPHNLKSLLAITELPAIDYSFFRDQWTEGTCEWILQDEAFNQWLHAPEPISRLLFLSGGAATGKSVLSSFIINHLVEKGAYCPYFFIRYGDHKKRTLSAILRSIAYQISQVVPRFSEKLELNTDVEDYETADARTIWARIFKSILFVMDVDKPIYWIIDGLDEAQNPREIIKILSDISASYAPIRILLIGRKTSEIESAFQKVSTTLSPIIIGIEGHLDDVQHYVRQELTMPGDSDFKEGIVKRVVERSQNNFLWAHLAVDKLNSCYRLADVELALQELPTGMEALYDRMASTIAQESSPTHRELASKILQFLTCSFRGFTVTELSQALNEDMFELLDLERSIVDLCGGFLTVDNDGNITLIHHTAREYLLSPNDQPFRINPFDAHERMFLSCMRCLMTVGLRSQISRNQMSEFVDYASSWWSSHLLAASIDNGHMNEVLRKFLTSHWVLTWIHALAATDKLQLLLEASGNLSKHYRRCQKPTATLEGQVVGRTQLEGWSTDFLKLVGKFGQSLQRDPESIYKLIPPICPRNSLIYQLFGKAEAKRIELLGASPLDWDELLARISLEPGSYASFVAATGSVVVILAPSRGVFVYDSSTFTESSISPIEHGERIYRMEINNTGTLLATYGYRTTKIWEISTGKCTISVDNAMSQPRPLTMLFKDNSTTLLVGAEDRRIRSLKINQQLPTWQSLAELDEPEIEGYFAHSSSYMAVNKDGTLVAVAYRSYPLSAWELEGPVHIGHCWRKREQTAIGDVIEAVWHPNSPELLGLYIDGFLFKWCPYDGGVDEVFTGASRMAMNSNGHLLATGDSRGMVKIFCTSNLGFLYQLASQDTVFGLAFSPDQRRLFDIRGEYGNVWEPSTLMQLVGEIEQNGSKSETEDSERTLSTYSSSSRNIDSITVLSASPVGHLYSYGTIKGVVRLLDLRKESSIDIYVSRGFLSIEKMCWSNDGRYFCFSNSAKRIFIMEVIERKEISEVKVETIAEISMKDMGEGPIIQLLFHLISSHLLVSLRNTTHIVSLSSLSVEHSIEQETINHSPWFAHPQDPELIVEFRPSGIHILNWKLVEVRSVSVETWGDSYYDEVDMVLVTQDRRYILVQMSSGLGKMKRQTLHYFQTSDLPTTSEQATETSEQKEMVGISSAMLPYDVSSEIAIPLSFMSHSRLIFLSKDYSICSYQVTFSRITPTFKSGNSTGPAKSEFPPGRYKPHVAPKKPFKELFLLPGDWISNQYLQLCSIWEAEKCFLCPRNGEVAIIKCAALV